MSRTRFVVLVCPKGGVGKTTLTTVLLASAQKAGFRALGVDTDSQGSLIKWRRKRDLYRAGNSRDPVSAIEVVETEPGEWKQILSIQGPDIVVVDTAPGHTESNQQILNLCGSADLVLVPTSSGQIDIDEAVPYVELLGASACWFVLNRSNRRTRSFVHAQSRLYRKGRVCPVDIPASEVFPNQYGAGLTPVEQFHERSEGATVSCAAFWEFACRELGLTKPPAAAAA